MEIYPNTISMGKNNLSERVVEYILTMDLEGFGNISVKTLAKKFRVNRCYLSKKFKDDKNLTLTDYIIMIKILRATALLSARHDLTTEDVARTFGYSNTPYFNRIFKRKIGTTPGKFKNYMKKMKSLGSTRK